ncbi:MAG: 3-keto-disaccharide hydrolase, partial [Bryobacteraceae bacterium]
RRAFPVALAALPAALAQRSDDYRDPDLNHDEGFTILFNGRDLKGWVVVLREGEKARRYREAEQSQQSTFSIAGGLVTTTGKPNGYIRTTDVYDNFVFHVEVRFPEQGNSGVLIHVQRDDVWPRGIECQLYQSHMGRIFPIQGATLEGGEMIHAAAKPLGEWNTYQVYSEEGRVATVLNGILVGLGSNANPRVGHICLQSEGAPAEFRNIKVRRYTPAHHLRPK